MVPLRLLSRPKMSPLHLIPVIFFFNILAALLFPHLGSWLGLSNQGFAIFAGTAVNDTSSVTATASSWDSLHGTSILEQATIVKLTRTLAIIPITLGLSIWQSKKDNTKERFSDQSNSKLYPLVPVGFTHYNRSNVYGGPSSYLCSFKRPFKIHDYHGHDSYRLPNKSQKTNY